MKVWDLAQDKRKKNERKKRKKGHEFKHLL
jgi:hypothetical protein